MRWNYEILNTGYGVVVDRGVGYATESECREAMAIAARAISAGKKCLVYIIPEGGRK